MLQRGNSDAAVRLRRAKSTSSVPKRTLSRKSIAVDPRLTYGDAITAATIAYDKAQCQTQASTGSGNITRTPNTALQHQGSHLARHRSGASKKVARNEAKLTVSHIMDKPGTRKTPTSTSQSTPTSQRTSIERLASLKDIEPRKIARLTQNNIPILDPPETKLLKARSNLVYKAPAVQSIHCNHVRQSLNALPFLATESTMQLQTSREHQTDEAIIALARDEYLQEYKSHQTLKQGRSSFFVPFASRLRKAKKGPLQTHSSVDQKDLISAMENLTTENLTDSSEAQKTRRFSMPLKKGLTRVFRGSSRSSSSEMPLQQVEATRAHYGNPAFRSHRHESNMQSSEPLTPDDFLDNEELKMPPHSLDQGHSILMERQSQQSLRSSYAASYPRSRVTSWNNSTRENTIVLPDLEQLPSIIESAEARKSPSLSSIHNHKDSACGNLELPLRRSSSKFSMSGAVDSRKLLSALRNQMKTARTKQKSSDMRDFTSCTTESWNAACSSLPQATSISAEPSKTDYSRVYDTRATARKHRYDAPSVAPPSPPLENTRSPSLYPQDAAVTGPNAGSSRLPVKYHTINPPGTALVSETQPITRWSFNDGGTVSRKHVPNTSNEWRVWAADEVAELDFSVPSFTAANNLKLGSKNMRSTDAGRHISSEAIGGEMDSLGASSNGTIHRRRDAFHDLPRLRTKRSENMNERFPILSTGRKASKGSITSARQASSSQQHAGPLQNELRFVQQNSTSAIGPNNTHGDIADSKVLSDLPVSDRTSSITNAPEGPGEAARVRQLAVPRAQDQPRRTARPSADSSLKDPESSPNHAKRRHVPNPAPLEENFLLRIRKGPYGPPSSSPSKAHTSSIESFDMLASRKPYGEVRRGMENTPPSRGQRMADEYLGGNSDRVDKPGNSSLAFI